MSFFLCGLVVALLAALMTPPGSRRASWLALLVTYGAPAAFVAVTLFSVSSEQAGRDAVRYRFALLGFGFALPDTAPTNGEEELRVSVGGEQSRHDVWVSSLASGEDGDGHGGLLGEIVFRPGREITFVPSDEPVPDGLAGLRRSGAPILPLRALEILDGDVLRVGDDVFTVRRDGTSIRFQHGGDERVLPGRSARLPLGLEVPIRRPLPAAAETTPLAWLIGDGAGVGTEMPAFFFWESRGFERRFFLAVSATETVTVERGGTPVPWSRAADLSDAALHVLSPPRWDGLSYRAGGVRDRRSFRFAAGERSLAVTFETPEVYVLSRAALAELGTDTDAVEAGLLDPDAPLRVHLSLGGWQLTDRSITFRHASRPVALEALATLELPRQVTATDSLGALLLPSETSFLVSTPRGQRRIRSGETFWLGRERLAALRIDVLRPPLLLGLLGLVLAFCKAAAARAGGLTAAHLRMAGPLEALLALRLLLGYRVWVMPPFSQESYELALLAWGVLPWVFLLVAVPSDDGETSVRWSFLPAWAGGALAVAFCAAFGGALRGAVFGAAVALAAAVGLLRHGDVLGRLGEVLADLLPEEPAAGRADRSVLLWVAVAFLPAVLRLVFLVLGYRESLQWAGQRFALTLLHLPLGLALEAAYLVWLQGRAEDEGELRPADLIPGLALVAGVWVVPALVVNDLGLALLNVPVFLAAWAAVALRLRPGTEGLPFWRSRRWWTHASPALLLGAFLVFAAFPVGARALLALIPEQKALDLESERNYLRLLAFAYPEELAEVARRGSEELAVMSAVMRRYTSGPAAGRGYFGSEVSPHIAATALREHAPAVFVAAEWGLLGTYGLVLLFLVALAGGLRLLPGGPADGGGALDGGALLWRSLAGLAALTFGMASLYMVLANYRLTLFTGKNVYLLGLDSTADVLEAVLLGVLFSLGAALARDDAERW